MSPEVGTQRKRRKDSRQQEVVCPSCKTPFMVAVSRLKKVSTPCCSRPCAKAYRDERDAETGANRIAGRQPAMPKFINPPLIRSFIAEGQRAGLTVAAMARLISANCATNTTAAWLAERARRQVVYRINPRIRQYMTHVVIQGMANRGEVSSDAAWQITQMISTAGDGQPGGPPILRNYVELLRSNSGAGSVSIEKLSAATGVRNPVEWLTTRSRLDDIHELMPDAYRHIAFAVLESHGPKHGLDISQNEIKAIVEATA